jgi:trans-AT polyketide synthase, acyltransferase and oxidoreductase domains
LSAILSDEDHERLDENVLARDLGSESFRADYGVDYAYYSGSMYKGIASKELVVRMARAGFLAFLGTGGMPLHTIEKHLHQIRGELKHKESFGVNLIANAAIPEEENRIVDLYLKHDVHCVEASSYMQLSPALVRYRLAGIMLGKDGKIVCRNRIISKISRPEIARAFLNPPPNHIIERLLAEGRVTRKQAELAHRIPVADDICAEADSGGHTDGTPAYTLLPTIIRLRDELVGIHGYEHPIRVGAAGGIGTPDAAAAAFTMGADFIATGSINQCTVEAGTSDVVKDMLQMMGVKDTAYAPAGDLFELGARIQVLKRGILFPARAQKLYELYCQHDSLEEIDENTRRQIQDKYFRHTFDEVWEETKAYYMRENPEELVRAEQNPKNKMALIFKWYFVHTGRLAIKGDGLRKVDFQIHCGPALGAFNQWVKGTEIENWRKRHVDVIASAIMNGAAERIIAMIHRYRRICPSVRRSFRDIGNHVQEGNYAE